MMNVSDAIECRRAVKPYDPDHRMSETEIDRLLSLALLSPTAWNIQHWRFVVVGKGTQAPRARGGQLPMSGVVIRDRYD
jgi:nitroreductase